MEDCRGIYLAMTTYLPFATKANPVSSQSNSDKARAIFDRLAYAAQDKCETQAHEGWTGHTDPSGAGPNKMVRAWGYHLPAWYSQEDDANNIESLLHNGNGSVEGAWNSWMDSEGHRVHLLGLDPFYAAQVNVGIGYYYLATSPKRHYWCVLTCPREGE